MALLREALRLKDYLLIGKQLRPGKCSRWHNSCPLSSRPSGEVRRGPAFTGPYCALPGGRAFYIREK